MAINKKLQKTTQTSWFPGAIPMNYKYTVGVAGQSFFKALKEKGQLLAGVCPECGFVYFPARMFCERCFARIEKFENVGLTGWLLSITESYEDFRGQPLDKPIIYGLIQMEGTDCVIIHKVRVGDPDALCVGQEVKAALAPKNKRQGAITDILYFTAT